MIATAMLGGAVDGRFRLRALVREERVEHVLDEVVAVAARPIPMRIRGNASVRHESMSDCTPRCPAALPPSLIFTRPSGKSASSWMTMTSPGGTVLPGELDPGPPAEVHERLGARRHHVEAVDGPLPNPRRTLTSLAAELAAPLEFVKAHPSDIVPGARVLASRVAEADDQLRHRSAWPSPPTRAPARRRRAGASV